MYTKKWMRRYNDVIWWRILYIIFMHVVSRKNMIFFEIFGY